MILNQMENFMKWVFAIFVVVSLLFPTFHSAQAWGYWGRPGWGYHRAFYRPFPRFYRPYYYYPRYYPAYYGGYPYAPVYVAGSPGIYFSSPGFSIGIGPGW